MNTEIIHLLVETGLFQFGRFNQTGEPIPFHFSLEMLPAYPDVLQILVAEAKVLLAGIHMNRLLCMADAVPFGVGLSLETGIPLVYSRGSHRAPVNDLVGAYDIGHPVVFVMNVLGDFELVSQFMSGAHQVGLEIHTILAIVDLEIASIPQQIKVLSLLHLPTMIEYLAQIGELPQAHTRTIQEWVQAHIKG